MTNLTTTSFVEGWRCPNRLWWCAHEPDAPERAPSDSDLLRMEQGQTVNELARSYVFGGTVIARTPDIEERLERTEVAIASGAPGIYNAAFRTDAAGTWCCGRGRCTDGVAGCTGDRVAVGVKGPYLRKAPRQTVRG